MRHHDADAIDCLMMVLVGFFNVSSIANSVPLYLSNAQFKGTPAEMADRIEVLWGHHEPDFYDTFFEVEPIR
jgi:hypothetical protein